MIVPYVPRDGDTDPAVDYTVYEYEDPVNPEGIAGGFLERDGLTNNDFCFTAEDFIETRNNLNDATHHQGTHVAA